MCFTLWICLFDKVSMGHCSSAWELVTFIFHDDVPVLSQYSGNSFSLWFCSKPAGSPVRYHSLLKTHLDFLLPKERTFLGTAWGALQGSLPSFHKLKSRPLHKTLRMEIFAVSHHS